MEKKSAQAYLQAAGLLLDRRKIADARLALQQAAALAPDEAAIYRALQCGFEAAGLPQEAVAAELAAFLLQS